MTRRGGFSLLEITVALLILGLSVTGLLNLLQFGQLRYGAIDAGWRQRQLLTALQRRFRAAATTGAIASLTLPDLTAAAGRLRVATWSWSPCPPDAVFVQARLFDDRNRNGRADPVEALPAQIWVFRTRTGR